jgi:hypothetical protein
MELLAGCLLDSRHTHPKQTALLMASAQSCYYVETSFLPDVKVDMLHRLADAGAALALFLEHRHGA